MSNDRAIAAVTATLRSMLFAALAEDPVLAGAQVTARPPDRARQAVSGNMINLYLYRTSIDAAWRNAPATGTRPGEEGPPGLPLVLSYLVTAYGESDDEVTAHRLLGLGMRVLHDNPVLARAAIARALPGSGLEDQVERVRIVPQPIPVEELSRLWSTFGTGYRLSASYDAAVVVLDSARDVRAPVPVTARGAGDTGPAASAQLPPALDQARPADDFPSARVGEPVVLTGRRLATVTRVEATGPHLRRAVPLAFTPVDDARLRFVVPAEPVPVDDGPPVVVPAGPLWLTAYTDSDGGSLPPSNTVGLAVAPSLTRTEPLDATLTDGAATLELAVAPPLLAGQRVAVLVGERLVEVAPPAPDSGPRSAVTVDVAGLAPGRYPLRLRVDGVDSRSIDLATRQPDPAQTVVLT